MADLDRNVTVELVEEIIADVNFTTIDIIPCRKDITDLDDVNINSPSSDDLLIYQGGYWVNKPFTQEVPTLVSGTTYQTGHNFRLSTLVVYINGIKIPKNLLTKETSNTFSIDNKVLSENDDIECTYIKL